MARTLVSSVVSQLQEERTRLEHELRRVTAALNAFGKVYRSGSSVRSSGPATVTRKHKISAEGRKRIAAAQKARWAKVRAAKKK
ncbi:MAG: hypothetical protein WAL71_00735 [Terriglobales bacterium]|jgi:hypothetical protein